MSLKLAPFRTACILPVAITALLAVPPAWGVEPCAQCHPREVSGFEASPMGRSMGPPVPEPSTTFVHTVSNTKFFIKSSPSEMAHGLKRGGFSARYKMTYAIGSGTHAIGYLVQIGDHLFQSPLTYYPGYGWGMAPGYENLPAPDFDAPISAQCLFCHSGAARTVRGTSYRYQEPLFEAEQITCARCHGPAEAHLRNPLPGSIINPAKLPWQARDSVCEQCHLAGEAFILNPGKDFNDFHPGENLEEVFSVYVFKSSLDPAHPSALTVVSQAQQLALSTCSRMSGGKLWCGTCHDPHAQPADPVSYFRSRCLSCHGAGLLERHPQSNTNCIGCHMPPRPVSNGGHSIFTDHRIAIYSAQELAVKVAPAHSAGAREAGELVAWRPPAPPLRERNLGLANVSTGEKLQSLDMVNKGYNLLLKAWSQFPQDPEVVTAIGVVLLGRRDVANAGTLFQRAILLAPSSASNYVHAALAWNAQQNNAKAIEYLNKALKLDPLVQQSYRNLAEIYAEENNLDMVNRTYGRFLKAFPKSIEAQSEVEKTERPAPLPTPAGTGAGAHKGPGL